MATKKNPSQLSLIASEKTSKEAFISIRNYLAGQFIGATRDDALLDEVLKCLFCKLLDERTKQRSLESSIPAFDLSKRIRSIFTEVKKEFPEIYKSDTEILLDPTSLQFVLNELSFSIIDPQSDPVGDAFEVFVGSESRGNSGQFFTPKSVTNFLVEALGDLENKTILDPACGAGGFLASVCEHLSKSGISRNKLASNLYGIDKDSYLAQLAKVHISLLTGGHPKVINGDSLSLESDEGNIKNLLPKGGVDVILTNPPFGVKIIAANPTVLGSFELARKLVKNSQTGELEVGEKVSINVPPQVLFVERCLSLLKPGGRLAIVLPESILSNKSYRHVVEYLLKNAQIHSVIGMPEALFKTSGKGGTHTKTCLLIATKNLNKPSKTKDIFMAEAKWCGQDSRARIIPNNDLPVILSNLISFNKSHAIKNQTSLGFTIDTVDVSEGILCPRYYDPQAEKEIKALKKSHNLFSIKDLLADGTLTISTGDEVGKLAYGTGNIPFIRTSDISNWELKADPKHGVSNEIYESLAKKQDVTSGDVLMVKDGTYLIGTCAIVTSADDKLLYQSHLYKIRVHKNAHGLNEYLLLALLSSTAVQKQIRSKQFTQDIIDSLGGRINELVLPIPKSKDDQKRISDLVKQSVKKRVEARELAKQARDSIAI